MAGATRLAARRPIVSRLRDVVADPATAFLLRAAAWFVGLLALLRLPWVETHVLLPYTAFQGGIAERLLGEDLRVLVAVSCSGSDAMAVCLGAILAFPTPWRRRLAAAAAGLAVITAVNILRLAHLSRVAGERELFDLLHRQVWPALIILVAAGYALAWMRWSTIPGGRDGDDGIGLLRRRLPAWPGIATAVSLVAVYYVFYERLLSSSWLGAAAERSAWIAGWLMGACGVPATVQNGVLRTAQSAWLVTPECVTTPLIPLAVAAVLVARTSWRNRLLALLALPLLFQALAVARLMVLAVPAAVIGSPRVAVHAFYQVLLAVGLVAWMAWRRGEGWRRRAATALGIGAAFGLTAGSIDLRLARPALARLADAVHLGHGYVDPQGALWLLPAFQLGLLAALWSVSGRRGSRKAWALAAALVVTASGATVAILGELAAHAALEPPVVAVRAWSLLLPAALAWPLLRPAPRREHPSDSAAGDPSTAA